MGTLAKPNTLVARKGPNAKRIVPRSAAPTPLQQVQQQQLAPNGYPAAAAAMAALAAPNPFLAAPTFNAPPPPNAGWGGAIPQQLPPQVQMQMQPPPQIMQAQAGPGPATASRKRKSPLAGFEGSEQDDYFGDEDDGPGVPGYGSHPRLSSAPYRDVGHTLGQGRKRDVPSIELRTLRPAYVPRERELTFEVTNRESPEEEVGVRVLAVPEVKTFGTLRVEDSDSKDAFEWRNFGEGDREWRSAGSARDRS